MPVKRPTRTQLLHVAGVVPYHEIASLRDWVGSVNHVATHTAAEQHRLAAEFAALRDDLSDAANVGRSVGRLGRRLVRDHAELTAEIAQLRAAVAVLAKALADQLPGSAIDLALDTALEPTAIPSPDLLPGATGAQLGRGDGWAPGMVRLDVRDTPGTELVVRADRLPLATGTLTSLVVHGVLELHDRSRINDDLLPYWVSLLRPDGELALSCPDLDGTLLDWRNGAASYDDVRAAASGSNPGRPARSAWTAEDLTSALHAAGLRDVTVQASRDGHGQRRLHARGRASADG